MPAAGAVVPARAGPGGAPAETPAPAAGGGAGNMIGMVMRMAFMWWIMSWFKGSQGPKQAAKDPGSFTQPVFPKGHLVDMYVFLTEAEYRYGGDQMMQHLIWSEKACQLALPDPRNISYTYEPTKGVQNNGSLWLHTVFASAGLPIDPSDPEYKEEEVFGRSYNMVAYMPRPKNATGVHLLKGGIDANAMKEAAKQDTAVRDIISFIRPNVSIQVVDHFVTYPRVGIPPQISPHMQFSTSARHYPIIFYNDFWLLKDKYVPMNETVDNVTLHLDLGHISLTWWQMLVAMENSFATQRGMGMTQEGESDELKRVFIEGNPVLLGITMVVSLLHTVFDMLAFKNDIGFWKNNKSMEGLSARSVCINAFCQLIILLYLFDNETSFVVLFSSVLGTAIEFWKVTKAMDVSIDMNKFPYLHFKDRATYSNSKTKQYDQEATKYLSYVLYPLIIGYAIYSLYYNTHKSWYSWFLSSMVGAVYMFGFILMCPQLYLNYRLKSVAHLPWRQMTYKFLNTIIDDLFAFVIKMPLLHRLSVFRDDLIFLIYIYQRWIYRVDMKRVNEFGWAGEGDEGTPPEAQQLTEGTEKEESAVQALEGSSTETPTTNGEGGAEGGAVEGTEGGALRQRKQGKGKSGKGEASAVKGDEDNKETAASDKSSGGKGGRKDQ